MRPTVVSSVPIPGWDCKLQQITSDQKAYVCSPSKEIVALEAWLEWKGMGQPKTSEEEAAQIWLTAETGIILAWEDATE